MYGKGNLNFITVCAYHPTSRGMHFAELIGMCTSKLRTSRTVFTKNGFYRYDVYTAAIL